MSEHLSDHPEAPHIPVVSDDVARAVSQDLQRDPDFKDRLFHDMNEAQHALIIETVAEANRQAGDDMAKKEAFLKGALFVLGAFRRQHVSAQLEELFESEGQAPAAPLAIEPNRERRQMWRRNRNHPDAA